MPAPLAVNREAVKAHAILHGIRPTCEHYGLAVSTVGSWSERDPEGPWCPANIPAPIRAPTVQPRANAANTPSVAARNSLENLSAASKLNTAKWGKRATGHAATLRGEAALAAAPAMQSTTRALANARLPTWDQEQALHLHLHRGLVPQEGTPEAPAIDV